MGPRCVSKKALMMIPTGNPTQVRVTFTAAVEGLKIDHASLGIQNANWDTTENPPLELKFSGASGFNIGASASIASDWLTLAVSTTRGTVFTAAIAGDNNGVAGYSLREYIPISGGTPIIVIVDLSASGPCGLPFTAQTPGTTYFSGSASYNLQNTPGGWSTTTNIYGISKVETQ